MKSRIVVSAIVEKRGLFLFGKKPSGVGPYPDTAHLIGGGVHLGEETLEGAMRREIREEAGIEVGTLSPVAFDEDREPDKNGVMTHYLFLIYRGTWQSGEPRPGDDISELMWVKEAQIPLLPLSRPSVRVFRALGFLP